MPLVYQQNINESTLLGIWHIEEPESFFLEAVPLGREITHPAKRLQHLAGRYLLMNLFPDFPLELIKVADTRRPFLENEAFHFSISHGGSYAAVACSRHQRVGVDIELIHPRIGKLAEKFLTEEERVVTRSWMLPADESFTMAWSIKEALFKWYAKPGMDFKRHLRLIDTACISGDYQASCTISRDGEVHHLRVNSLLFNGFTLSWVCA